MDSSKAIRLFEELKLTGLDDAKCSDIERFIQNRLTATLKEPNKMTWNRKNINLDINSFESVIRMLYHGDRQRILLYYMNKPQELITYKYFQLKFNKDYEENYELFSIIKYSKQNKLDYDLMNQIRDKSGYNWKMLVTANLLSILNLINVVPFSVFADLQFLLNSITNLWQNQRIFYIRYRKAVIRALTKNLDFEEEFRKLNDDAPDNNPFHLNAFHKSLVGKDSEHWKLLKHIFTKQKILYDLLISYPKQILRKEYNKYPDLKIYFDTLYSRNVDDSSFAFAMKNKARITCDWSNLILIDLLKIDECVILSHLKPHKLNVKNSKIKDQVLQINI